MNWPFLAKKPPKKIRVAARKALIVFLAFAFLLTGTGLGTTAVILFVQSNSSGIFQTEKKKPPSIFDISTASAAGDLSLEKGWNLISPVNKTVSFSNLKSSNPSCNFQSGPWYWDKDKYVLESTMLPMRGYWVFLENDCSANVGGSFGPEDSYLNQGWNLVSVVAEEITWDDIEVGCRERVPFLFYWNGSKYEIISSDDQLEQNKGYWVYVDNSCNADGGGKGIDVGDLPDIDPEYNCLISQGSPTEVCDPPQEKDAGGTTVCRYSQPTCAKNAKGSWEWQCNYKEDPKPVSSSDVTCTDAGWIDNEDLESMFPSLQDAIDAFCAGSDPLGLLTKIVTGILGKMLLNEDTLAAIFGKDIAKIIKTAGDFYFWLTARGIDPIALASDPRAFEQKFNEFLEAGKQYLVENLAPEIIKNLATAYLKQHVDPAVATDLGNFIGYVAKRLGKDDLVITDLTSAGQFMIDYAQSTKFETPLLRNLLRLNAYVELVTTAIGDSSSLATIPPSLIEFVSFILNDYSATKNAAFVELEGRINAEIDVWLSASGVTISLSQSTIRILTLEIINEILAKAANELGMNKQELSAVVKFVDYLINNGFSLNEVAALAETSLISQWQSFISSAGLSVQIDPNDLQKTASLLVGQIAAKIASGAAVELGIDPKATAQVIEFVTFLLVNKGFSIDQLKTGVTISNIGSLVSDSGKPVGLPEDDIVVVVNILGDSLKKKVAGELGVPEELVALAFKAITEGLDIQNIQLTDFINFDPKQINQKIQNFVAVNGTQILQLVVDTYAVPAVEKATGAPAWLVSEVGKFLVYLTTVKNIDLNTVATFSKSRVEELVSEYISNYLSNLLGIDAGFLKEVLLIVLQNDIIGDIIDGNFKAIIEKLTLKVDISGGLSCPFYPPDPVKIVCALLSSSNWRNCTIGSYSVSTGSTPNDLTINAKGTGKIRGVELGVCETPNIEVSILGKRFGIPDLELGPIAWRSGKIWLELPTHFRSNWDWPGTTMVKPQAPARTENGVDFTYGSDGTYWPAGVCRFVVDIFGWPPARPQITLWKADVPSDNINACGKFTQEDAFDVVNNDTCP